MLDGMPMVSVIFLVREDLGSKLVQWNKTLAMNNMRIFLNLNENLSKIQHFFFLHQNQNFKIK
jgi:hypothetical protein